MAWTRDDLAKLDQLLLDDVQEVQFADGRRMRKQPKADMLALRREVKSEIAAAESQVRPRHRFSVARMRRP